MLKKLRRSGLFKELHILAYAPLYEEELSMHVKMHFYSERLIIAHEMSPFSANHPSHTGHFSDNHSGFTDEKHPDIFYIKQKMIVHFKCFFFSLLL